jgi:hypothetical protein
LKNKAFAAIIAATVGQQGGLMAFKLAENLVQAVCEEQWVIDLPDPEYGYVARAKGLADKLVITSMHFTQSLWWGINHHRLNEVLGYFENKYHEALPNKYQVIPQDLYYFQNLPTDEKGESECPSFQ